VREGGRKRISSIRERERGKQADEVMWEARENLDTSSCKI